MIDTLAYLLPALGCAAMMGAMMWMMMGRVLGGSAQPPQASREGRIEGLRAEVAAPRQTMARSSCADV